MSWVAVAIGGSALVGGIVATNAANTAANTQSNAANQSNSTELAMYNQTRDDNAAYRAAGTTALAQMQDPRFQQSFTAGDLTNDPGYQFRMQEGLKAIQNSASAKGGLGGGATMKALNSYGQGVASQEYQAAYDRFNNDSTTRYNRLASLAGLGQTANSATSAANANYANAVSANDTGAANASGAAAISSANSINGVIGQGLTAGAIYSSGGTKFSDARLKTDITPVSKSELAELKANLKAYIFKYKSEVHGKGEFVGVMAQDLEKSKLGRTLVSEDPNGNKKLELERIMMLFLATLAEG